MKIRWYHWAVYKLWRFFWNPILRQNVELRDALGIAFLTYKDPEEQ